METEGTARWDQVSSLTIGTAGTEVQEGVGLGPITVVQDGSSLEHLSSALGMRTFLLSPTSPTPEPVTQIFSALGDRPAASLASERVSPWRYRFRMAATEPYTLIVSNTYHPLWRVITDGREISPQPSYYFVNAYAIDKVGEYDLTLEFVGQRYQWYAFSLSGLAFGGTCVALAGCLLRRWRRKQCTRCWTGAQDPMDRPNDDC